MSIFCSTTGAVSKGYRFIVFKVLTLKDTRLTMFLRLNWVGYFLTFFEHWCQSSNFSKKLLFYTCPKSDAV